MNGKASKLVRKVSNYIGDKYNLLDLNTHAMIENPNWRTIKKRNYMKLNKFERTNLRKYYNAATSISNN